MTDALDFNQRLRKALEDKDMEEAGRLCADNVSPAPQPEPLTMIALAKHFSPLAPKARHRPKGKVKERLRLGELFHTQMANVPRGKRTGSDEEDKIAKDICQREKFSVGVRQLQDYRAEYNRAVKVALPVLTRLRTNLAGLSREEAEAVAKRDCEDIDTLFRWYCIIEEDKAVTQEQREKWKCIYFEDAELIDFFEPKDVYPNFRKK